MVIGKTSCPPSHTHTLIKGGQRGTQRLGASGVSDTDTAPRTRAFKAAHGQRCNMGFPFEGKTIQITSETKGYYRLSVILSGLRGQTGHKGAKKKKRSINLTGGD